MPAHSWLIVGPGPALKEKKAEEEGELEVLQVGPSIVAPSGNQLWAIWCEEVFTHAGRWLGSRETTDGAGTKALERGTHWVLFFAKSGQEGHVSNMCPLLFGCVASVGEVGQLGGRICRTSPWPACDSRRFRRNHANLQTMKCLLGSNPLPTPG